MIAVYGDSENPQEVRRADTNAVESKPAGTVLRIARRIRDAALVGVLAVSTAVAGGAHVNVNNTFCARLSKGLDVNPVFADYPTGQQIAMNVSTMQSLDALREFCSESAMPNPDIACVAHSVRASFDGGPLLDQARQITDPCPPMPFSF